MRAGNAANNACPWCLLATDRSQRGIYGREPESSPFFSVPFAVTSTIRVGQYREGQRKEIRQHQCLGRFIWPTMRALLLRGAPSLDSYE